MRTNPQTKIQDYCAEQNAALTRSMDELRSENTRLTELVSTHEQGLVNALDESKRLQATIDSNTTDFENAAASMQELRDKNEEFKNELVNAANHVKTLSGTIQELRDENAKLKQQLEEAQAKPNTEPAPARSVATKSKDDKKPEPKK